MDEKNVNAREVFQVLCDGLDQMGWNYDAEPEKLKILFHVKGEDLPMTFVMAVDADRKLVSLISILPFRFKEEKILDGAIATCYANYKAFDGSFDLNIRDGSVAFRMTTSYRDSIIGPKMVEYLVGWASLAVDDYNDKFFMINQGMLSVEDFITGLQ